MKDKIKKIGFILAEIGVVIWAIIGMKYATLSGGIELFSFAPAHKGISGCIFYFLSAVLILYLLRKYEPKS